MVFQKLKSLFKKTNEEVQEEFENEYDNELVFRFNDKHVEASFDTQNLTNENILAITTFLFNLDRGMYEELIYQAFVVWGEADEKKTTFNYKLAEALKAVKDYTKTNGVAVRARDVFRFEQGNNK